MCGSPEYSAQALLNGANLGLTLVSTLKDSLSLTHGSVIDHLLKAGKGLLKDP